MPLNKLTCQIATLFIIIFCSCNSANEITDQKCSISSNRLINSLLSFYDIKKSDIAIRYNSGGETLEDLKYNYKIHFSANYFDALLKYSDDNYSIIYCPKSGIMNALTLFPKTSSALYIIDRLHGKPKIIIQSKDGIEAVALVKDSVYFQCRVPNVVRVINLN